MKTFSSSLHFKLPKAVFSLLAILFLCSGSHAQWVQTAGPTGISVNVFYNYGSYLFSGTYAKGVFRSSDNGLHWEPANGGLENSLVYSFTNDANYLYAGTEAGVYRSSDNGATWTAANSGITQQSVYEMTTGGGYVFAGTIGSGVFKSSDQGATWSSANGGTLTFSFIMAMCYVNNKLIVEGDNYLYVSTDFGNSWDVDQGNTAFYPIQNIFAHGDTLFASAYGGTFYSYDAGDNWSTFNDLSSVFGNNVLGFAMSNDTVFAGLPDGMFYSTDFGQNWTSIPQSGLRFGNRFNNHFIKSGPNYLIGMDELGVYLSQNTGSTWGQAVKGFIPASTIDNSMITIGNDIWTGTHTNGVFKTTDNGFIWTKVGTSNDQDSLSNGIVFAMLNPDPDIILAGTCSFGLYRSADNGATWTHITSGLPWEFSGYECDFSLEKAGPNVIIGTDNGLFYSTDDGLTWQASNIAMNNYDVEALAVNGTIAVAGLSNGNSAHPSGIYRSTNNGVTWTNVSSILDIICMASDGVDHFYAGTFEGNFVSADNGLGWNSVGPGIPSNAAGFTIKAIGDNVFIGNDNGVYFSSNNGATFTTASDGLDPDPNNAVQGFASNDQYVFAGLFRDAVWKRPLSDFGIVATAVQPVDKNELVLYQNSPNPFSNSTTITYSLPAERNISITVTDVTGKIVFQSEETKETAGTHSIIFNGEKLAAGIYMAQLKAGDELKVMKMVVER